MNGPAAEAAVGPGDRAVIAGELGRTPRDLTGVSVRCPFGYPAVTESAPVLSEGSPNPTLLYVTCPSLDTVISRVEGEGGVRDFRATCRDDSELRALLDEVTRVYRERRTDLHRKSKSSSKLDARLGAGIGGPEDPEHASCLHAYAAALLSVISGWLEFEKPETLEAAKAALARFLPPVEEAWCTDRRCSKWQAVEKRAVIDVGTISVRLLIADMVDGRPWTLLRRAEVTRLGQGLVSGGPLNLAARIRTSEAVARLAGEARLQGVDRVLLAGTSATREASDGEQFLRALASEHDLRAKVLSGEREAQLSYAGACLDVCDPVVLDVGGGSTELITRLASGRVSPLSLPLGANRGTEKWIKNDPPTHEELDRVAREAAREFAKMRNRYGRIEKDSAPQTLVGVAGTVTTLAALAAGLEKYDSAAIHLRRLTLDEVCGLLAELASLTTEGRAALPCVQAGRAPMIVAGAAIVMAAMEVLGYDELTVSERDLLDGLAMEGL
jgi:exopolyphosphatase/guanosine-5'-triphosphate,3'-diphosphate pyrophosphatase